MPGSSSGGGGGGGTAPACSRFKQNTWKKELCSNCYRPKEEHSLNTSSQSETTLRSRLPLPSLPELHPSQSILSNGTNSSCNNSTKKKAKKKKKSVSFRPGESEVIGFDGGSALLSSSSGDSSDSSDEEDLMRKRGSSESEAESSSESVGEEEERALAKLTKSNTDFNSTLGSNLPLLPLGKQQKQTLQVTIQPFSGTGDRRSNLSKYLEEMPLIMTKTPTVEPTTVLTASNTEQPDSATPPTVSAVLLKKKTEGQTSTTTSQRSSSVLQPPQAPSTMPHMKTIIIEGKEKAKDEMGRPTPEGRKSGLTRRSAITKNSGEQVKSKLYINSNNVSSLSSSSNVTSGSASGVMNKIIPSELRKTTPSSNIPLNNNIKKDDDNVNKKTDDINKIIINTGPTFHKKSLDKGVESRPDVRNSPEKNSPETEKSEVIVSVLKLTGSGLAESRESAGEPDGKADSDEAETPPLLSCQSLLASTPASSPLQQQQQQQPLPLAPTPAPSLLQHPLPLASTPAPNLLQQQSPPLASSPAPNLQQHQQQPPPSSVTPSPVVRPSFLHRDSNSKEPQKDLQVSVQMRLKPTSSPVAPSSSPPPLPVSPPPSVSPPPTPTTSSPSSPTAPPLGCATVGFSAGLIPRSPPASPQPRPVDFSPPSSPPARSKRPAPKPPSTSGSCPGEPSPATPRPRLPSLTDPTGLGTEKKKARVRATLRKLLRFSSGGPRSEELLRTPEDEAPPVPRPRPQIIHPLDLNKSAVQVLPSNNSEKRNSEIYASTTSIGIYSSVGGRPSKPPPPPRSESLNLMERLKPAANSENNVYANLGEGRTGIAPVKPQRSGSLRTTERQTSSAHHQESTISRPPPPLMSAPSSSSPPPPHHHQHQQSDSAENLYECVGLGGGGGVSSAPECDMSLPPYYGSETESDIYYPYVSFQNGECLTKMKRRERGMVHSTLEENYGAVVIANYEALSHLLNKLKNQKAEVPQELLSGTDSMTWDSFSIDDEEVLKIGSFTFLGCSFKELKLCLCLGPPGLTLPDELEPLTSLKSCRPPSKYYLEGGDSATVKVTVLKRKKLERLSVYAGNLEKSEESVREGVHVLLQVVKHLSNRDQVNMDHFVVISSGAAPPTVAYLPTEGGEPMRSSVECLREMTSSLIGPLPLRSVLLQGSSTASLREAAEVLELWLWGPTTPLTLACLGRWLDLERATFLQKIVLSGGCLVDSHHLTFLVRATPKSIARASQIIQLHASP